ncbi:MAG: T9SS type A sorting domain-containing protein [Bacteroidetes bacterium]|nr:T9SS type A sorting domain-containing protein [Bacteroidota bacterium]
MNKLVTRFLFLSVVIGLCSPVLAQGSAVAKTGNASLTRRVTAAKVSNAVLPHVSLTGKPANPAAFRYDSMFYVDTTVLPLLYSYLPSYINTSDGAGGSFVDTITSYQMRMSAPYACYVDTIEIAIAIPNLVQMATDSLNANALTIKLRNNFQPSGNRLPYAAFGKAIDSVVLSFDDLSGLPTDGSFFPLRVPMNHKRLSKDFFVEIQPAIDFVNGTSSSTQNYFAILHDSVFFDLNGNGVDITKVRGYFTRAHNDTSSISIFIDQSQNAWSDNYWVKAWVTNNPNLPDAVDGETTISNTLGQNFPNPFNPSTEIHYSLTERSNATLKVYNTLGREVATLVDGMVDAGQHQVTFHAENLPSGTYYYTLKAGEFSQTKRMVLAK